MIRVLVADDNPVLRLGIVAHLSMCDGLSVVGEAADGLAALDLVARLEPDVLVLDIRMPHLDGLGVLDRLTDRSVEVLVLTNTDDPQVVHDALTRGARGYLVHPQHDLGELEQAVRQVARGEITLGHRAADRVLGLLRDPAEASGDERDARAARFHLSDREAEVLDQVALGRTNQEIAHHLYIAEKTVKNHLNRVFPKLGASTRASAMAIWRGDREPERPSPRPGHRGQALPLLVLAVAVTALVGLGLVQAGSARVLQRRAETAADAAALGAARALVGRSLGAPAGVDAASADEVEGRARSLAGANRAELLSVRIHRRVDGVTVTVTVRSRQAAGPGPLAAVTGGRPLATAAAALSFDDRGVPHVRLVPTS